MTDNIQKLYEIAGVEDIGEIKSCSLEDFNNCENLWIFDCLKCEKAKKILPPFTAEKQLELIKWVSNFKVYESVIHKDRKWFMCASIGCNDYCESRNESFEQALASLILELWKDLTDDQKQEIKRILQ